MLPSSLVSLHVCYIQKKIFILKWPSLTPKKIKKKSFIGSAPVVKRPIHLELSLHVILYLFYNILGILATWYMCTQLSTTFMWCATKNHTFYNKLIFLFQAQSWPPLKFGWLLAYSLSQLQWWNMDLFLLWKQQSLDIWFVPEQYK